MNFRTHVSFVLLISSATVLGCSSSNDAGSDTTTADDSSGEVDDLAGKADGTSGPLGVYVRGPAEPGMPTMLVFMTDKTYHRETLVTCVTAPCYPVEDNGAFKFTQGGSTKYVRFTPDGGSDPDRWAYRLSGDTLQLRKVYTKKWYTFERDAERLSWCETPEDCKVQGLSQIECVGEWTCSETQCSFDCSSETTACADAGGSCIPLSPSGCPSGQTLGDAQQVSCGPDGVVGLMCCLPEAGECLFGSSYPDSIDAGLITETPPINYRSPDGLDSQLLQQIVIAAEQSTDEEFGEPIAVFDASESNDVLVAELTAADGRLFRSIRFYPGGNPYGAIFRSGTTSVVAVMKDDSIYYCTEMK